MDQLVFLLMLTAVSPGDGNGPGVTKVIVEDGSDAILPCSLNTKEDIEFPFFDWKKDDQNVFLYDEGNHYNNDMEGQDEQFKGRVSHFQDELKSGNASIIIRNAKVTDSGNYTCDFPLLQPRRKSIIWLVVSAALKPYTIMGNATEYGVTIKCEVRGAFPEPKLQWQDSDGKVLPADEPHVSERGGRYYITLQTTVNKTKTNRFVCVAKQEDISHIVDAEITVPEKMFEECKVARQSNSHNIWLVICLLLLGCVLVVCGIVIFTYSKRCLEGSPTVGH